MDSQGVEGWEGMMERGHASPRETLLMRVRVEGQIGMRESINVFQRVGRRMTGIAAATVVGCARR